ncbi:MAG: hypothetical protein RJB26_132 [Pseudomonadota bacterium]|jgi:hypothetical protein
MAHHRPLLLLCLVTLASLPAAASRNNGPANPAAQARFRAATVEGPDWSAREVVVAVTVDARNRPQLDFRAGSAVLPGELGQASQLHLHCPTLDTPPGRWRCRGATLQGRFPAVGEQTLTVDFDYEPRAAKLELAVAGLQLAGGTATATAATKADQWTATAQLNRINIAALQAFSRSWVAWPEGSWAGILSAQLQAQGSGPIPATAKLQVALETLDYSSTDGLTATAALAGEAQVTWEPSATAFNFAARSGQVYLDPVFLDAGAFPFELQAAGELRPSTGGWQLADLKGAFHQRGLLTATATGAVDFGNGPLLSDLALDLKVEDVPKAWPIYAGPFLASTDFKDLTATGQLSGNLGLRDGEPVRANLRLQGMTFADPTGALELRGVGGALHWAAEDEPETAEATRLAFDGGRFYGLPFGATALRLQTHGRDARLLEPFTLPILDGGLQVDTFRVRHAGEPGMWLRLDAAVLPIDMAALSRAFGWPVFGGKLAGRIPKAALDDGVLTLGGNLEAEVFGGRITLQHLRLQDALGRFPQFQADVALENLDLALVTGTFEFGYISGRLSGAVNDLQLFDWRPVAFDARLATPPDYTGDRRITPRAVQNLSSLGGGSGVTSALSGGFLRFFKDFEYRQLGIACRLEQDVCAMGGVAPAPGGYYLIEGAGFPRINLIGSQGRVAWSKLLRQLERLSQGAALEVK